MLGYLSSTPSTTLSSYPPSAELRPSEPVILPPGDAVRSVSARAPSTPRDEPLLHGGWIWALLLLACVFALALVMAAPWTAHHESPLAGWLYLVFFPVCHQIGERSFHFFGHALAVCHRCSGLYVGFTLGLALLPALPWLQRRLFAEPRWLLAFAAPMAADVFLWQNTWWSRTASGLLAAFPVGLFVWAALRQLTLRHRNSEDTQ